MSTQNTNYSSFVASSAKNKWTPLSSMEYISNMIYDWLRVRYPANDKVVLKIV